jgi:hypothetical protein
VFAGLLRIVTEVGPGVSWFLVYFAAVLAVFVIYIGIALVATLSATDEQQQRVRHEVFRDLLALFRRGGSK